MDNERFEKGISLVREAGAFLKSRMEEPCIEKNFAYDVKLRQDRESEEIILGGIGKFFPGDGFLSEERGSRDTLSGYLWTVDPLDGTFNYSRGLPHCCVSVSCTGGGPDFGIVYDFFRQELFSAQAGRGAFLNGARIHVSETGSMKESVMCFGLMKGWKDISSGVSVFNAFAAGVRKIRMLGAAALDLCYVASGRVDFFVETGLKPWDTAAGSIIVREAGGIYNQYVSGETVLTYAGNGNLEMDKICRELAEK